MEIVIQQFLRERRSAIAAVVAQQALDGTGYFAQLTLPMRTHLCDRYTELILHAMLQGYIEREKLQALLDELAPLGILLSELQAHATRIEAGLVDYIRQELADDPEACKIVLTRLRQAYSSLLVKLTASRIDQQFNLIEARR